MGTGRGSVQHGNKGESVDVKGRGKGGQVGEMYVKEGCGNAEKRKKDPDKVGHRIIPSLI